MVLWQSPDTPVMSGFSCERAASSVLESCALSSAYIVLCGAWCLDPGTHVFSFGHVSGFGHSRSIFCHCVSAWSRVRSAPRTLVHVCFVVLHAVRVSIGCMHLCYILCCVAHGWWFVCWPCACVFVLCEHVASVLVFCVPCALMSICLDPTHHVTCLLINFPQLFSLVTLIICSLYNLLVFAVPCGFVT